MIVGMGLDLVEIDRVAHMIESLGDRMYARLFSESEAAYIRNKPLPAQHAAVRLAAKEAAFKALAGNDLARGIGWRELEVLSRQGHAPVLLLHGRAADRASELVVTRVHLSLTHTEMAAAAYVIAERE
jgi:holo-[acyl-carrier protein] synthase